MSVQGRGFSESGCEMQGTESLPIPSWLVDVRPGAVRLGDARRGQERLGEELLPLAVGREDQRKSRCGICEMTRNGKEGR